MTIEPTFAPELTLADVIRRLPEAVTVFEAAEIDYSCQGARTLSDAASDAGYTVETLIEKLEASRRKNASTNWFHESMTELLRHLTSDHRTTVGEAVPALQAKIEQAIEEIGEIEDLKRMRILFANLVGSLNTHTTNEERDLFPFITDLDAAVSESMGPPRMRISQRVLRELVEHETFRDRLRTLCELCQRLPNDKVVVELRTDLRQLSNAIHRHMHLENNVLYPRAIEIENGLRRNAAASA